MPVTKTEKLTITLTPSQKERIETEARERDMSVASFIRYSTLAYIDAINRYKKSKNAEMIG